ncbi:PepSY domain-containing protein [Bacillus sp. JJ1533]|uniref:PepSY domain-containing protein n=1 Tax=Bacillus sp. JJ1533 TaxID=3122959 RepID=UPI002FFE1A71
MKKKLVVLGIVGAVVLGGAVGVGAIAKEAEISHAKAIEIATQEVKGSQVEEIELERENGELVYEVELEGKQDDDIEVKVNATTGKVVRVDDGHDDDNVAKVAVNTATVKEVRNDDRNDDDDDQKLSQTTAAAVKISKEQAISIATKDTPGKIVKIELDDDLYYEIEMIHEGKEAEFEISAVDGKILKKEIDDRDDDDHDDNDDRD